MAEKRQNISIHIHMYSAHKMFSPTFLDFEFCFYKTFNNCSVKTIELFSQLALTSYTGLLADSDFIWAMTFPLPSSHITWLEENPVAECSHFFLCQGSSHLPQKFHRHFADCSSFVPFPTWTLFLQTALSKRQVHGCRQVYACSENFLHPPCNFMFLFCFCFFW